MTHPKSQRVARKAPVARLMAVSLAGGWVSLTTPDAHAWIFHEHQVIAERAVQALAPEDLAQFDALWGEFRSINPERLCERPDRLTWDDKQKATCVSFAALPAIAGDHSCSPQEMWDIVTESRWILDVEAIAHETRLALQTKTGANRVNAWNYSNLLLERADPDYSSRASANYSHFVPVRTSDNFEDYMRRALLSDSTINAVGAYAVPHWAALRFALEASKLEPGTPERREMVRLAMSAEAFAVHYLQDAFSSGHVVGRWGSTATAKGTHDHYCLSGIDGTTWDGDAYSAYGDAYMTEQDIDHALNGVRASLEQLLRAFGGDGEIEEAFGSFGLKEASEYRAINGCLHTWVNVRVPSEQAFLLILPIWKRTLKPGPGQEQAHLPRFKAEIGSFFGFSFNTRVGGAFGGYFSDGDGRVLGDVSGFASFGFGVEGATGLSSDGTFMLGIGLHGQAPQFDVGGDANQGAIGTDLARVPGRLGLAFLVRMPFFLLPGDLLLLGPLIAPFSLSTVKNMAVDAADGGLLSLQRILVTDVGDFQFVLGREIQITPFGIAGRDSLLRYDGADTDNPYTAITFGSLELDFPVFQWRFFRAFSQQLTSSIVLTVGGGIDIPFGASEIVSGASVGIEPVGFFYFRLNFDGRIYFEGPLDSRM
jgi:hypothetical protein